MVLRKRKVRVLGVLLNVTLIQQSVLLVLYLMWGVIENRSSK